LAESPQRRSWGGAALGATLLVATLFGLTACGHQAGTGVGEEKVLNVYSWTDYIAPDTVANFERETGIQVRYDTYESNEVLETKLLTGHTNYDIVVPTDTFFERLVRVGVFRKLDVEELPNRSNLDPDILRRLAVHDPGNAHAVPYLWSTVGLGYDVQQLAHRLGTASPAATWALLFDPRNAVKLQDCGISVIDSPAEVFAAALLYLGRDPNSRDPADAADALGVLMKIRPYVRSIETTEYIGELANGSLCLTLGWSGDVLQARERAREAGRGVQIGYLLPTEGSLLETDMMAIPTDAPHPHNAERWLNYLMRPEVMAAITNAVQYPNGNAAALGFVDERIKTDPGIYPPASERAKLRAMTSQPPEYARLQTRLWTAFRTGQAP
jgi:putrescine transport system substrate-binding protein